MDRISWQKVLSRIFVEEIPEEFLSGIVIQLHDGGSITVQTEDELISTIEALQFQSEKDPVESIELGINYTKVKEVAEADIAKLMDPIISGKGEKN